MEVEFHVLASKDDPLDRQMVLRVTHGTDRHEARRQSSRLVSEGEFNRHVEECAKECLEKVWEWAWNDGVGGTR